MNKTVRKSIKEEYMKVHWQNQILYTDDVHEVYQDLEIND
jgi:hypothetical protein